jgi:hypothetical protein
MHRLHLNLGDLQDFLAALGGSCASGLSRILRRFPERYGRRRPPSAFSLVLSGGSGHEHERVDVTRRDRCELAVVEGRDGVELAALGERDYGRVDDAEGQVLVVPIVSCAISAQSTAALPAWQRRPLSCTRSPSTSRSTVRPPERGDARRDGARVVRVEVRERQRLGLDLRPS